jgi:hypothetical protein
MRYNTDHSQPIIGRGANLESLRILSRSSYHPTLCRVFQEERSVFWEAIVSVILSKIVYMHTCPIPNIGGHARRKETTRTTKT